MKIEYIEKELALALYRFSDGRLTVQEATGKAKVVVPKVDWTDTMIAHKGINWYAKQILKAETAIEEIPESTVNIINK